MVEEEKKEEGAEGEKPKKSPLKLIIIILVVVLLGAGGFVGWTMLSGDNEAETDTAEASAEEEVVEYGKIYPLDFFVVNLADPGGKRYLKTKVEMEYFGEEIKAELEARLPQLRDAVLIHLSSKSINEIQTIEDKIALKNELILRINQLIRGGKISNLYFTEFVIQ
ncbi:MAG: flagellar basal body-associated FliL family protein [Desulfobacterales bacterium]|nr:flagellar basal body-associated FliL family protein [Desulfobacterales bacterium]